MELNQLIQKCKKGDRDAQNNIYKKYCDAMFHVSLRLVKSESLACDVLQDSFVSVFKNMHQFQGKSSLGAWIKRIVINNSLQLISKESVFTDLTEGDFLEEDALYDETQIEELLDAIKDAMQELPNGTRTIFSLFYFEGYDLKEIAGICKITSSTVKTQLHYGRKLIRKKVSKMEMS